MPDRVVRDRVKYQLMPFICSRRSLIFAPRQTSIRATAVVLPSPFRESVFVASLERPATMMFKPSRKMMDWKVEKLAVSELSRMAHLPSEHAGAKGDGIAHEQERQRFGKGVKGCLRCGAA